MSEKKLVLPLSYTNIGDHGGLKTTSAGAAVHAPVRPVSTEYWLDLLSEDIPLHERKLIEYAKQLESNGKHRGWALEDSGRLLRVKGRWGVDIEVTVDQFAIPPKVEYVGKDCVRRLLRGCNYERIQEEFSEIRPYVLKHQLKLYSEQLGVPVKGLE